MFSDLPLIRPDREAKGRQPAAVLISFRTMARVCSSSGRVGAVALAGLCLWVGGNAFVASSGTKGLRGSQGSSHAGYAPFPAAPGMTGETEVRSSLTSGLQAVLLAGVFGMMVGMAPVRAEEAAPAEAAPATPAVSVGGGVDNMTSRKSKRTTRVKKEKKAAATSTDDSGKKKRVIISPADELDEDELSPLRPNPPLLFLIFATPVTIYLTFYVLGSLNII